ncbi:hypothetical protein AB0K71_13335 [Streptomyces syringium]|uniref:hypothetical protein n=1 Tax=Streptomyces syringium TaxID=76729 RepID=UPI0033B7AF3C
MRIKRILAATAALTALVTTAACDGGGKDDGRAAPASTNGTDPAGPDAGPPSAGSLAEAQKYVQRHTSCEQLSTEPADKRMPSDDPAKPGAWSVTERGVCSDQRGRGQIVLYRTSDMKAFQAGYKKHVSDAIDGGKGDYGLFSRVFVGKDFAVVPRRTESAMALAKSGLRILTCNPTFGVPKGYKKEKALVEHCVLSDFVHSQDGKGSVNHQSPEEEGRERGESARPKEGRKPEDSLGLAEAGSLAELKKLVHHEVGCEQFSTDPETVSVSSIDYLPAIEGDHKMWGVGERGMCGYPGGDRRAHDLSWLDKVDDMITFQTKAKAAQLKELRENGGRYRATRSMVLVGKNVAVETNDPSSRHGLYQAQFLHLNCQEGFTAPEGYRFEKALVNGCVLTNYEGS